MQTQPHNALRASVQIPDKDYRAIAVQLQRDLDDMLDKHRQQSLYVAVNALLL